MPGITNPAEPYFKDGLWGWVTDQWKKLVATAGGALHIQFAGQEADVEVTQTAAADLTPGVCGWDGTVWRKLPLVFGFSEVYHEQVKDLNATVTSDALTGSAVDPGEIWVVTSVVAYDKNTNITEVHASVSDGATWWPFAQRFPTAAGEYLVWSGMLVLEEGDYIDAGFGGTVAGDDIYLNINGYKMKIAE